MQCMQPVTACCSLLRCVELIARTESLQKELRRGVMQFVAAWCKMLQCVAVSYSVLECVELNVTTQGLHKGVIQSTMNRIVAIWHSVVAACSIAVCCSALQRVAACCNVSQRVVAHWAHCANCTFTKGCAPVNYKKMWGSFVFTTHTHIHTQPHKHAHTHRDLSVPALQALQYLEASLEQDQASFASFQKTQM